MVKTVRQATRVKGRLYASALKITVIVSLVIAILLGSLIYLYTFYRQQDDRMVRQSKLLQIMESALSLSQSEYLPYTDTLLYDQLYAGDTLSISKSIWGLYDKVELRVRYDIDSLQRAFLLGQHAQDSTVLYVADEDRNLSVSGKTRIVGNAFLPRAGIKPAFVDARYYEGEEAIVEGKRKDSDRILPAIAHARIDYAYGVLHTAPVIDFGVLSPQQRHSFFLPTIHAYSPAPIDLSYYALSGNMVLYSDTAIHIGARSSLQHLICIAPFISVENGFQGSLQLFATDSIAIGERTILDYPSAIVLRADMDDGQKKIRIGKGSRIHGSVLLSEQERSILPHSLELGEDCTVYGDLICFGMLQYQKKLSVFGGTYCYRFITRTPSSLYENYLIDLELDRTRLSPHFLHGYIWARDHEKPMNRILTWLD